MTSQDERTIEIDDLDSFVNLLLGWHSLQVATLKHLEQVPEGTQVTVDDVPLELVGDTHSAFVLGIQMSLEALGKLPFEAITEEDVSVTKALNEEAQDA